MIEPATTSRRISAPRSTPRSTPPAKTYMRLPVIALLLAVAFAGFTGVQVGPALRKATAALTAR